MATFEITEGAPGQGKSLYTARKASQLLKRNKKWYARQLATYEKDHAAWEYKKSTVWREMAGHTDEEQWLLHNPEPVIPQRRLIASNIKFGEEFEKRHEGWILYWVDTADLIKLRDVDVLWDEIATELDARNWVNLTAELKRFLSQYRKRGVDIYANTQDFSMIDARARLMITSVKTLRKVIGSPDLSTTKPPPKRIWGLVFIRQVTNFKETDIAKKQYNFLDFSFMLIEKDLVDIYDTRQDIKLGTPPPLHHEERVCELHGASCNFKRITHA